MGSPGPRHIAVVGGGITGLSAARGAVLRGRELGVPVAVTVLESSPRFGGNVVTEQRDGFVLDGGPDSWVTSKPEATALARELGLGADLIGTNESTRRYYVAWKGRLHPVPEGLVLGVPTQLAPLAGSRLFSWRGKLRMALEPFVRARRFDGDDDESIADFARRRLGREAADRLVAPLLGGISAGDANELSVRAAFPQLVAMERDHGSLVRGMRAAQKARAASNRSAGGAAAANGAKTSAFLSLTGGLGRLVGALERWLVEAGVALRPSAPVCGLAQAGDGFSVALGEGESLAADGVVVSLPAQIAAPLLASVDSDVAANLAGIRYGSTATVFLSYRRAELTHPLDGVGFVVPRSLGTPLLASTWVSSKWAGRAPEGYALIRAFFGGAFGEDVLARDDEALAALAQSELLRLMGIDARPLWSRVFRFNRATAQMRVGHVARMRGVKDRLAQVAPRIRLAGGGYDGVGIPDCIRQGHEAGAALISGLSQNSPGSR